MFGIHAVRLLRLFFLDGAGVGVEVSAKKGNAKPSRPPSFTWRLDLLRKD